MKLSPLNASYNKISYANYSKKEVGKSQKCNYKDVSYLNIPTPYIHINFCGGVNCAYGVLKKSLKELL